MICYFKLHARLARQKIAIPLVIVLATSACGGGEEEFCATGQNVHRAASTLVLTMPEASGVNCTTGGYLITAGIDANLNGALDDLETTSRQYLCHGAAGPASLVKATAEPAGMNCASGGSKIEGGLDSNSNGALDTYEVTTISYVCQNRNDSRDANGLDSLIAIVSELAGEHCAYGGSKVTGGLDINRNGVIDPTEVRSTEYICDGKPGRNFDWVAVIGNTVQAESNMGYLANSAEEVVITLPTAPSQGDLVRVSGSGAGGWHISQNPGQSIITKGLPGNPMPAGQTWVPRENTHVWRSIASSADGSRVVAADFNGQIYVSGDSGATWSARDAARQWFSVASSADGGKLVAVAVTDHIYTSIDAGTTWVAHASVRDWRAVASSSNGVNLVALEVNGQISTSVDSGLNWTVRDAVRQWSSVASSADGNALVATVAGGYIYTSSDAGLNWTARESTRFWLAVASSADGVKLVAVVAGGQIFTSTDSGHNWTARDSARDWVSVASSADGINLTAADYGGRLYVSNDSGLTWTPRENSRNWYSVASSADGNKLFASEDLGSLYTSVGGRTTPGVSGSLSGTQFEAIELQYIGDGLFIPLSYQSYSGGFISR